MTNQNNPLISHDKARAPVIAANESAHKMRVLIADDHDLVRDALKQVLSGLEGEVEVLECSSFPEAMALAEQDGILDLAVLDLQMPGMTGPDSAGEFCRRFPQTPTVILSGYYRRQDIVEAFQYGAAGFIPKTLNSRSMLNALRLVLAGEKYIPADLLPDAIAGPRDAEDPYEDQAREYRGGKLTVREAEVLAKLCQGLSNKAIAKELGIEEVTVKLHLRKVYKKLGARNRAHAVTLTHNRGTDSD